MIVSNKKDKDTKIKIENIKMEKKDKKGTTMENMMNKEENMMKKEESMMEEKEMMKIKN